MLKLVFRKSATFGLMAVLLGFTTFYSFAQEVNVPDNDPFKIERVATVDISEVLRQSKATGKIRALLDKQRKEFQEQFTTREADLLARQKELQDKRDVMSKEAYDTEVRAFQAEVADVQREIQEKRKSLDNTFQQAQDQLRAVAFEIVKDVAQEKQLDLILNRGSVPVFKNQLDITAIVLAIFNERTKDARLEVSEVPPPADVPMTADVVPLPADIPITQDKKTNEG